MAKLYVNVAIFVHRPIFKYILKLHLSFGSHNLTLLQSFIAILTFYHQFY